MYAAQSDSAFATQVRFLRNFLCVPMSIFTFPHTPYKKKIGCHCSVSVGGCKWKLWREEGLPWFTTESKRYHLSVFREKLPLD